MKVFITKREPHPVKFGSLNFGDCFHYENIENNETIIGMVTLSDCVNLLDGMTECLYEDDLAHKVEVKIVNEI